MLSSYGWTMTKGGIAKGMTRWRRSRFPVSLAILIIVYAVGTIGILSRYSERFVELTFANLVLTALLLLLNAEGLGRRAAVGVLLSIVVGFSVEVLGVKTGVIFGEYHYTDRMGPRLFDVPLVIGVNWAILIHAVHTWVGARIHSSSLMAVVGATAMTALDGVMEPVAIRLRFWVWRGDTVPLRNYLAWWVVSFVLLLTSDAVCRRPTNRLSPWVLGTMLAFFAIVGWSLG